MDVSEFGQMSLRLSKPNAATDYINLIAASSDGARSLSAAWISLTHREFLSGLIGRRG